MLALNNHFFGDKLVSKDEKLNELCEDFHLILICSRNELGIKHVFKIL